MPLVELLIEDYRAHQLRHAASNSWARAATQADTIARLRHWFGWWDAAAVADLTAARRTEFVAHLRDLGLSRREIDRILSTGRSALRRAYKDARFGDAPDGREVEIEERRAGTGPWGRPLGPMELANLLDAIEDEPLWRFVLILLNTMCHPAEALALRPSMVDHAAGCIVFPGRSPTDRPRAVPLTDGLADWLARWAVPDDRPYVGAGSGVGPSLTQAWRRTRGRVWPQQQLPPLPAGATKDARRARALRCGPEGQQVTFASIRLTLVRVLRQQRVPADAINLMLGRRPVGEPSPPEIPSPLDPELRRAAAQAIDAYLLEVHDWMGRRLLLLNAPPLTAEFPPAPGAAPGAA